MSTALSYNWVDLRRVFYSSLIREDRAVIEALLASVWRQFCDQITEESTIPGLESFILLSNRCEVTISGQEVMIAPVRGEMPGSITCIDVVGENNQAVKSAHQALHSFVRKLNLEQMMREVGR